MTKHELVLLQDAERLRQSNRRLLRQLADAKAQRQELVEAVYKAAYDAAATLEVDPVPSPKPDLRRKTSEVAIAILSDLQLAKRTATYNSAICAERIARYADKVVELTRIQRADHPVKECRVYLLGDWVEGEIIFAGQAWALDSSLYEQILVTGRRILVNFVRQMLLAFERVHVVGVAGNHGCCPAEARAVTADGFKRWDEITADDRVLSVDDDGQRIWQPIHEVLSFPYDGPLVRFNSRHCNFAVTPDHRVVGLAWDSWRWIEPPASHVNNCRLVVAADNSDEDAKDISDDDIRLTAWCMTDSHRRSDGYWTFYQRFSKADRIERLLVSRGLKHGKRVRARDIRVICGKVLKVPPEASVEFGVHADSSRWLSRLVPERDTLPSWIWSLSRRQVAIFLEELIYTDGSVPKGNGNVCLYVSRTRLREDIQRLLITNGYRATQSEYRPGHWRLNITSGTLSYFNAKSSIAHEQYRGTVWCLRVPNGRFFAEEHGKVFLTGNSLGGRARREYHPESNADMMLYETARLVLKGNDNTLEPRLTWAPNRRQGLRAWYAVDTIGRHGYLLFHGDQVRGGYADFPWYGFGKKILRWSNSGIPEKFTYALSGHFHTPARNLYGRVRHWASGSTESSNEYAAERIGNQGDPSQWLLFAHPERGVTAEYEVHLL